ncbi:retrovirus-related pol polyprotein from transposon TNT 1-94 [Tanacetum coccineum]
MAIPDPLITEAIQQSSYYPKYLEMVAGPKEESNSSPHSLWTVFQGNLKFVPKGETVEVFGMAIPNPFITEAIQQSSYYPKYLEMVAKNTKKTPQESASRAPPKKPTTTTPVKQTKPAPAPTKKPSKHKLPQKVRKGKPTFQLVDEDDEAQQEYVPQEKGDDPNLELAKKMSLEAYQEKGEGEGANADMERAIKLSLDRAFLPQGQAPIGGVTIRDPVSETTPKLPEVVGKGKAIVTEEQVAHSLIDLSKKKRTMDQFILVRRDQAPHDSTTGPSSQPEDDTSEKVIHESSLTSDSEQTESKTEAAAPKGDKEQAHEALAGPDPEPMQEDQTGSNSGKLHVSLAGPNPEHMDDEFLATAYPKVHENLKLITDERVIEDNPESHSGSMSSMKNLKDTDNFGDQFLYDKPTEDDQEKSKVVDESDSTIPDPSHQTVMTNPPVIAPNPWSYEFSSSPKLLHCSYCCMINNLGTKLDDALLRSLERHTADLIEKYSELPGPESVKNQESEKSPKEIIRIKREQGEEKQESTYSIRSTDKVALEEFDLKSALFKHMNKNRTANRNPANYQLYHTLMEALIADEDAMDKGKFAVKRRRPDSSASGSAQPPPKVDDQSSKKQWESDASASKQHPTLTSTGWQITDTKRCLRMKCMSQINGRTTNNRSHPRVSTTTWFKPIPEGERPATPEPEWTIPPNDFPEPENNWANTYATTYQVPRRTSFKGRHNDIRSFIQNGSTDEQEEEALQTDLEGPLLNIVKAFIEQRDKERKIALSISKLKAAHYLDFGLEELVPSLWVESEREYDISADHLKKDCPKRNKKKSTGFVKKNAGQDFSMHSEGYDNGDLLMAVNEEMFLEWIMDSGGSYHMTPGRDFLFNFKEFNGGTMKENYVYSLDGWAESGEANVGIQEKESLAQVWYKCLGHISEAGLHELERREMLGKKGLDELEFCEKYVLRKSTKEFNNLCKESRIVRHLTFAGTPQHNGLAEQMNRILLNKVRCLLIKSGLPDLFWAEAMVTTTYLINRSPSTGLEKKTPMDLWPGHSANYEMLRIFGCVAYSRVNQGKLKPRAIKCIFLSFMYKDTPKGAGVVDSGKEVKFEVELQDSGVEPTMDPHTMENPRNEYEEQDKGPQQLWFREHDDIVAYAFAIAEEEDTHEPIIFEEAINSSEKDEWVLAIKE